MQTIRRTLGTLNAVPYGAHAGFRRPFLLGRRLHGALQNAICCHANKGIESGIWHTLIGTVRNAATRCIAMWDDNVQDRLSGAAAVGLAVWPHDGDHRSPFYGARADRDPQW